MNKTRDTSEDLTQKHWFAEDQAQWWDDQKRDEEELQRMREEDMMDDLRERLEGEVKALLRQAAVVVYKRGFINGFSTALIGALAFIYFV